MNQIIADGPLTLRIRCAVHQEHVYSDLVVRIDSRDGKLKGRTKSAAIAPVH